MGELRQDGGSVSLPGALGLCRGEEHREPNVTDIHGQKEGWGKRHHDSSVVCQPVGFAHGVWKNAGENKGSSGALRPHSVRAGAGGANAKSGPSSL